MMIYIIYDVFRRALRGQLGNMHVPWAASLAHRSLYVLLALAAGAGPTHG